MRFYYLSLTLFLVNALAASTAYGEDSHLQSKNQQPLVSVQPSGTEEVASAQGGVHLLEHILQRMRNLPQLAISKTKQTIAFQSQAQSAIYEPSQATNLLIKPKDLPRAMKPRAVPADGIIATTNGMTRAGDAFTNANEIALGGTANTQASAESERQEMGQSADEGAKVSTMIPGIGKVREYSFNDQEDKSFKDERNKRIISTAPLITEFAAPQPVNQSLPLSSANRAESSRSASGYYNKSNNKKAAAGIPLQSMLQGAPNAHFGYAPGAGIDDAKAQIAHSPSEVKGKLTSKETRLPATRLGGFVRSPGDSLYGGRMDSLNKLKAEVPGRDLDIALTPPTVITGITLVRLGNSEKEAAKAIASLGKAHKELIHGWSVWSVHKRDCKDCSIQVFIRHGMVEAIRIFDPSLLRPELGVNLGDCLSAVKEKFGEPAFILSESTPPTTQNYIYPISQIGFQFARGKQNDAPKIVSMIVFNVK